MLIFKINGHRLKPYFGGAPPTLKHMVHLEETEVPLMEVIILSCLDVANCLGLMSLVYMKKVNSALLMRISNGSCLHFCILELGENLKFHAREKSYP